MNDTELVIEKIKNKTPFAVCKFGDGEVFVCQDKQGKTCDGHTFFPELKPLLIDALKKFASNDRAYLGRWKYGGSDWIAEQLTEWQLSPRWIDYSVLLHDHVGVDGIYKTIQQDDRQKILVCSKRVVAAGAWLGAKTILVPQFDCFTEFARYHNELFDLVTDDSIVMLACSLPSKVLTAELLEKTEATVLDVGSGLDPLFFGNTRKGQVSPQIARGWYGL